MLKGFLAVFKREFIKIFRNRHLRLVCLISPFCYCIILTGIYYQKRITNVPVGIVDMDNSYMSRQAISWIDATENIAVKEKYFSQQDALNDLIEGKIYGFFYFPEDFSSNIKKGGYSSIKVAADYMNIAATNPIFLAASEVSSELSGIKFSDLPGMQSITREHANEMKNLVRADVRTIFNSQMNYSDFFIPGLILVIMQQIIIVGLSFTISDERQNKKEKELYEASGKNLFSLLLGKVCPYIIVNFVLTSIFVFGLLRFFNLILIHSFFETVIFVLAFVAACSSFGLMISALFKNTVSAFMALMFFSMPAFLVSGFSWPQYMLPIEIKIIAAPIPSTYFMGWLRRAFGAKLSSVFVCSDFWIMIFLSVFYISVSYILCKYMYRTKISRII